MVFGSGLLSMRAVEEECIGLAKPRYPVPMESWTSPGLIESVGLMLAPYIL